MRWDRGHSPKNLIESSKIYRFFLAKSDRLRLRLTDRHSLVLTLQLDIELCAQNFFLRESVVDDAAVRLQRVLEIHPQHHKVAKIRKHQVA